MKSLQESLFDSKTQMTESLFDTDLAQQDIHLSDLYELSQVPHHFQLSNNFMGELGDVFLIKSLKSIKPIVSCPGTDYWGNMFNDAKYIPHIITAILENVSYDEIVKGKLTKDYTDHILKYIRRGEKNRLTIYIDPMRNDEYIKISIYIDLNKSRPHSLTCYLTKKGTQ